MDLTVREAARRVGRTQETVRRWIWSGRLPARKIGNTYRLSAADVDAASAGIPTPRSPEEGRGGTPQLGDWLDQVREWQASNAVEKHPGAWRMVIEDRIERSGDAGR